ncbi:MAG: hypothetical protein KDK70_35455, partial [Myxococcales bacterium]|nr:hypothetical protein [Myxococcales bacterium]
MAGLLLGVALGGCGAVGEGGTDTELAPGPAVDRIAEEIGQEGGVDRSDARLVIAVRRVPDSLDPLDDLDPWGARVAEDLVFQGLTRRV